MTQILPSQIEYGFDDGQYYFIYKDSQGTAITQGNTVQEFLYNIQECLDCHFGHGAYDMSSIKLPLSLFRFNHQHAAQLQNS